MAATAAYLPTDARRDPATSRRSSSRRARGVEVWAALRTLGRAGVAELVERCCRSRAPLRRGAARRRASSVLNDVVLNQVLVSFGDAGADGRVIAAVQRDGTCWCGPTTWHGMPAMRISVSGWNTTEDDIDRSIAAVRACAARLDR